MALGWVVNQIAVAWLSYQRADVLWNRFHWDPEIVRSMESATGLLYIEFALVMASTIVAAALLFGEGMLV